MTCEFKVSRDLIFAYQKFIIFMIMFSFVKFLYLQFRFILQLLQSHTEYLCKCFLWRLKAFSISFGFRKKLKTSTNAMQIRYAPQGDNQLR